MDSTSSPRTGLE